MSGEWVLTEHYITRVLKCNSEYQHDASLTFNNTSNHVDSCVSLLQTNMPLMPAVDISRLSCTRSLSPSRLCSPILWHFKSLSFWPWQEIDYINVLRCVALFITFSSVIHMNASQTWNVFSPAITQSNYTCLVHNARMKLHTGCVVHHLHPATSLFGWRVWGFSRPWLLSSCFLNAIKAVIAFP